MVQTCMPDYNVSITYKVRIVYNVSIGIVSYVIIAYSVCNVSTV